MKIMTLLFFAVILSSCGQSKEKKAVCDAYDEINECANKADFQTMNTCSVNAAQKAANKLQGKKLKISEDQLAGVANAALDFQTRISSATSEFRTSSIPTIGANITPTTDTGTPTTSTTEMADKLKEAFRKCVGEYTGKVKSILECE